MATRRGHTATRAKPRVSRTIGFAVATPRSGLPLRDLRSSLAVPPPNERDGMRPIDGPPTVAEDSVGDGAAIPVVVHGKSAPVRVAERGTAGAGRVRVAGLLSARANPRNRFRHSPSVVSRNCIRLHARPNDSTGLVTQETSAAADNARALPHRSASSIGGRSSDESDHHRDPRFPRVARLPTDRGRSARRTESASVSKAGAGDL